MHIKKPRFSSKKIIMILGTYIMFQIFWWAYVIYTLQTQIYQGPQLTGKSYMIIGEGAVFVGILILGLWHLNRSLKKELELVKMQRNFLMSITHEIKTPLAALRLSLQTIKKRDLKKEQQQELLNDALLDQERLENLLENFITAKQLDDHQWALHPTSFHPEDEIRSITTSLNRYYKRKSIQFEITAQEVSLDKTVFNIIVSNLVDNALKYSKSNEKIGIELRKDNRNLKLTIWDEGQGVSKEDRTKIWNKFYRAGDENTRKTKGTGLGLFLVKSCVELYKGKINMEANSPKGTRIEVTLPQQ